MKLLRWLKNQIVTDVPYDSDNVARHREAVIRVRNMARTSPMRLERPLGRTHDRRVEPEVEEVPTVEEVER